MVRNVKFLGIPLLLCALANSQTLPAGVQKITSVEGITEYSLPNGLHVLLFPDASKPKLTVNMTYLVGSRQEGYGETGMAHLLEHMLFKITKGGRDVKKDLTDHGAQWNGTTSWDRTNYFETVNASDDEPQVGAGAGSRPHGQHADGEGHPRHRNDGGAERVRDRREPALPNSLPARSGGRPTPTTITARCPSATGPISSTCRWRNWPRSTRSITSRMTPC